MIVATSISPEIPIERLSILISRSRNILDSVNTIYNADRVWMNIFSDSVNPSFNCKRRSNRSDRESDFKKTIVNYSLLSWYFFLQKRPFPKAVFCSENWISFDGLDCISCMNGSCVQKGRQAFKTICVFDHDYCTQQSIIENL